MEGVMRHDSEFIACCACDTIVVPVEKVLRVVEACSGKPFGYFFVFALLNYLQ
jgi:hypothetical protein